jgi:hypothetical protein
VLEWVLESGGVRRAGRRAKLYGFDDAGRLVVRLRDPGNSTMPDRQAADQQLCAFCATNVIERLFEEVKKRSHKMNALFHNEGSCVLVQLVEDGGAALAVLAGLSDGILLHLP